VASTTSISTSGLQAAQARLNVAAGNIANTNTPGYQRREVVQEAKPGGGVAASVRTAPAAGADLAADVVGQLQAKNAFLANLAVFKTADRMAGALLNEKA